MKKSAVVITGIAVLGAVWLGSSWYTGKKLETEAEARIALANEQLAQIDPTTNIVLSQLSFDRGLFSSQARHALVIGEKDSDTPSLHLEFDTRFEHGPFPAGALTQGRLLPTLAVVRSELARTDDSEEWFVLAQGATPMHSEALLSYSGDADYDVRFAPLNADDEDGLLRFSGASLQGHFLARAKRATGTFSAPSLVADRPSEDGGRIAVTLTDAQLDFDVYRNAFDVESGTLEMRIAELMLHPENGTRVSIERLVYGGDSTEDDRFIRGKVYLSTGALTLDDVALGNQAITLGVGNLEGQTIKLMSESYSQLTAKGQVDIPPAESEVLTQAFMKLLAAGPTLTLENASWTTEKGTSELDMHTIWQAPTDLDAPMDVVLLQALKSARLTARLDKPMLTDLVARLAQLQEGVPPEQAQALANQQVGEGLAALDTLGLLELDGDAFTSLVEYDGETVKVNGEPLSSEAMLGLLMLMM